MRSFNIRIPDNELEIIKQYASQTSRTQSDIVRAFIRSLEFHIKYTTPPPLPPE